MNFYPEGFHAFLTGKMGDICYALPAVKALGRERGEKIHFMTSGLCHPLVPLLREQPYLASVQVDEAAAYELKDSQSTPWFEFPKGVDGINMSVRPEWLKREGCWTDFYVEVLGVKELKPEDGLVLPSLLEHRYWYYGYEMVREDNRNPMLRPNTLILAPESETMKAVDIEVWVKIATALKQYFKVIVVGLKLDSSFPPDVIDMRGATTVCSMARMLAEARMVVTALSLPFHLARHALTPTFVLADVWETHSFPVDTLSVFYTSKQVDDIVETGRCISRG